MKNLKKLLAIVMAVLLVGVMAACGGGGSAANTTAAPGGEDSAAVAEAGGDDVAATEAGGGETADLSAAAASARSEMSQDLDGITIGINVKTLTNSYFREMAYASIQACNDLGIDYLLTTSSSNNDLAGQIEKCEDMLTAGIDALVITPQNSTGIATLIDEYNQKGVPTVVVDTAAEGCEVYSQLIMDEPQMGADLAEYLAEKVGGKGKVILLEGVAGTSSSDNKAAAFKKYMEENTEIEVISQNANYAQEMGQTVTADLLQANPDVVGVAALNDMMMLGAIVSIEEAGLTCGEGEGKVCCCCMSIDPVTARYIQDGHVTMSLYSNAQVNGYNAVVLAVKAIRGEVAADWYLTPYTPYDATNIEKLIPELDKVRDYNFNEF